MKDFDRSAYGNAPNGDPLRAENRTLSVVSGPFGAAEKIGVPASKLESKIKARNIDKRRFKSP